MLPSGSETQTRRAFPTTCAFVNAYPSGVKSTPVPPPRPAPIPATAGPVFSTTPVTAREYASSSSSSSAVKRTIAATCLRGGACQGLVDDPLQLGAEAGRVEAPRVLVQAYGVRPQAIDARTN